MQQDRTVHAVTSVRPIAGGFEAVGLAIVEASPWRSLESAKAIAQRIAAKPAEYLPVIRICSCPGIREASATF